MMTEYRDMTFQHIRKVYNQGALDRKDLQKSPIDLLKIWLSEAIEQKVFEANAMSLATASEKGELSLRMVLLKKLAAEGLSFFTNFNSKKAKDISENPKVALNLWWKELERQVNIQGKVEKLGREEAELYFETRGRESQIAAWASEQSQDIKNRESLDKRYAHFEKEFIGKSIECPPHWGAYLVKPTTMEFWQGRTGRLHDRFYYFLDNEEWLVKRLSP